MAWHRVRLLVSAFLLPAFALWAQAVPFEEQFLVKIRDTVAATTSRKGDKITAVIINPERYRGGFLEGDVEEAEGSTCLFSFDTLLFEGRRAAIESEVTGVRNSKGNRNVDDHEYRLRIESGRVTAEGHSVAIEEGAEIRLLVKDAKR